MLSKPIYMPLNEWTDETDAKLSKKFLESIDPLLPINYEWNLCNGWATSVMVLLTKHSRRLCQVWGNFRFRPETSRRCCWHTKCWTAWRCSLIESILYYYFGKYLISFLWCRRHLQRDTTTKDELHQFVPLSSTHFLHLIMTFIASITFYYWH